MDQPFQNYVGGRFAAGDDGATIAVEDPATGGVFAEHALAGPTSFEAAVIAARSAFEGGALSRARPAARTRLMFAIADSLRQVKAEGGRMLCLEGGKALSKAEDEFEKAAAAFEYYGGLADKLEGRQVPVSDTVIDFTMLDPLGVSVQIVPWNFPVSIAARSMAAALATGNSVILKSPELTPIGLHYVARAIDEAGVPKGCVSVLAALGHVAGEHLINRSDIDQITFTGSVGTGQAIMAAAARTVTPTVMELGGKSAGIALEDADTDKVLAAVKASVIVNAGQICSGMTRLLVHRSRYHEILDAVCAMGQAQPMGPGIDENALTPVVSEAQRQRIIRYIEQAQRSGQEPAVGGGVPERTGYFHEFTVFADVDPHSPLAQEEIFGPVLCVMPFDDEDEAVRLANVTPYGLSAGIFSNRLNEALRIATRLRAGQVYGNQWHAGSIAAPFGGFGRSGFGRERGYEAIYNYAKSKNIAFNLA